MHTILDHCHCHLTPLTISRMVKDERVDRLVYKIQCITIVHVTPSLMMDKELVSDTSDANCTLKWLVTR